jgi:hypothetical protein
MEAISTSETSINFYQTTSLQEVTAWENTFLWKSFPGLRNLGNPGEMFRDKTSLTRRSENFDSQVCRGQMVC